MKKKDKIRVAQSPETSKKLKTAEETLLFIRKAFESSGEAIGMSDPEGHHFYQNKAFTDLFEYTAEELEVVGGGPAVYVDQTVAREVFDKIMRGGAWNGEIEVISRSGRKFPVLLRADAIKDDHGRIVGLIGIHTDITERKLTEHALRKSEEKYRTILENIEDGYYEVDLAGNFTFFNAPMCRILGYPQEEMMGMNNRQFTDKENAKKLFKTFNEVYRTGEPAKAFDWQIIRKDRTKRYIETSISLRKDSSDRPVGFRGIVRDITERKQAEEALRESEKYFKEITENSSDIIVITDKNGDIKYCSRSIERFTGYKPEKLIGTSALTLIHPDDKKRAVGDFGKAILAIDSAIPNAFRIMHKDGSERYFGGLGKNLLDNPAVAGFIMNVRDVTERKQAEKSLQRSEEKYRNILENMQEGYFELDLAGNFTFVNDAECRNIGYPREELLGMNNRRYQNKTSAQKMYQLFSRVYKTGEPVKASDIEIIRKNGTKNFNEVSVSLIRDAEGKPIGFRGISRDITERKQAEEALRENEELFRSYLEYAPDGVYMNDMKGNFLYGNRKSEEIIGYRREELIGKNFLELNILSENSLNKAVLLLQANMEGKSTGPDEIDLISKEGRLIPVEINTNVVQRMGQRIVLAFVRNITERKQAEEERKQSFVRLRKALGATVQAISMTVEMKDPYTSGHQRRVSDLARSIAKEMDLSADRRDFIRTASSIHDIGKISIPTEILSKPTKLTDLEFSLIKTHSQSGYDILKDIEFPWPVANVILQHHERLNGSGYPQGLKGNDILLEARIMAVADVVESMASHRPYRPALGIEAALKEIEKNKGILYDDIVADACLRLFRKKSYQLK